MYRPGQANWEYTMWKFQESSATQILREINFSHFEATKNGLLTILAGLNFEFWGILEIPKISIVKWQFLTS